MSTDTTIVESTETDLDAFAAELFGQSKAAPEETTSEDTETEEDDVDAQDTHVEDDTLATEEIEEAKPPKKSRFQERIDEVVGKQREAERKAQDLEQRLNEALQRLESTKTEPPPQVKTVEPYNGPKEDDLNEDGTEKYPLGQFDPAFIRDQVKYTLDEERRTRSESDKKEAEQKSLEQAQAALQKDWNDRLVPAKERYPDFQEKGEKLVTVFEGIDQAYGEYLTNTLMEMEYGPDVLYYLANNIDEAQKIVQSGAKKATVALGRLEAKFLEADEEKQRARPKVSQAPPPPAHLNKGSSVAMPYDMGDLDAFSKQLFKKK